MCMVGDDDYWIFYNEFRPKARKDHTCGECRRTIPKGEFYRTQGGLYDGGFEWNKTCVHCDAASEWLVTVCEGYIFGRRLEDFMDHVVGHERYIRSRPLVKLVRWMRAGWRDRDENLRPVDDVRSLTLDAIGAYDARAA